METNKKINKLGNIGKTILVVLTIPLIPLILAELLIKDIRRYND